MNSQKSLMFTKATLPTTDQNHAVDYHAVLYYIKLQ